MLNRRSRPKAIQGRLSLFKEPEKKKKAREEAEKTIEKTRYTDEYLASLSPDRAADFDPVAMANRYCDTENMKRHIVWLKEQKMPIEPIKTLGQKKWIRWCEKHQIPIAKNKLMRR